MAKHKTLDPHTKAKNKAVATLKKQFAGRRKKAQRALQDAAIKKLEKKIDQFKPK